jgi:predicted nucleic acid-binding protein
VIGELACGNLQGRKTVLADFGTLPKATTASDAEVMLLIEKRELWGRGLGWVDAHLLASARLSHSRLWTLDKRLAETAGELDVRQS